MIEVGFNRELLMIELESVIAQTVWCGISGKKPGECPLARAVITAAIIAANVAYRLW